MLTQQHHFYPGKEKTTLEIYNSNFTMIYHIKIEKRQKNTKLPTADLAAVDKIRRSGDKSKNRNNCAAGADKVGLKLGIVCQQELSDILITIIPTQGAKRRKEAIRDGYFEFSLSVCPWHNNGDIQKKNHSIWNISTLLLTRAYYN